MASNIIINNFQCQNRSSDKKKLLKYIKKIDFNGELKFLKCYKKNYQYSYDDKIIKKYKRIKNINIIGMGGSSLGTRAIYSFLSNKIKKKIKFFENLKIKNEKVSQGLNIIVSKSGNTLETILNTNKLLNKKNKNIFIT